VFDSVSHFRFSERAFNGLPGMFSYLRDMSEKKLNRLRRYDEQRTVIELTRGFRTL